MNINKQKQKPALWEQLATVMVLFLSTGAVVSLLGRESIVLLGFTQEVILKGLWLCFYAIIFLLLLLHWRQIILTGKNDRLLCLLVGLAFLSVVWTEVPLVTVRCSIFILATTAFGVYLAIRYTRQELLKLLVWTFGLSAVISLGLALLLPAYGIHQDSGALRGIYGHKNGLGCYMALAALIWLLYSFSHVKKRLMGLGFCGISIALFFLAKSVTALVVFSLPLLLLLLLLLSYRLVCCFSIRQIYFFIFIILVLGSLAAWLINNLDLILAMFGRDITLTGRTRLWQALGDMIRQRPWLGYGYGAFWLGWEGPSSYIWQSISWEPKTAHNGYLDLWLQLGAVGVAAFLCSLCSNLFKALIVLHNKKIVKEIFPLLLLVFMIILNIPESFILVRNSMFWILYVAVTIQLSNDYSKLKRL
ncbi:MAG: O-antigen ligase [Desulfotomaculaceae bacterium]|nr:O-antigen ligase [Desulfotomaculaceae bacterium]